MGEEKGNIGIDKILFLGMTDGFIHEMITFIVRLTLKFFDLYMC